MGQVRLFSGLLTIFLCMVTALGIDQVLKFFPYQDMFIEVGKTLNINCSIVNQHYLTYADHLRITYGTNDDVPECCLELYPEEGVLSLTIVNVTSREDTGFTCDLINMTSVNAALKRVHVGHPPQRPENLTCVSRNWQDMVCRIYIQSHSSLPTNWSIQYKKTLIDRIYDQSDCSRARDSQLIQECSIKDFVQSQAYLIVVMGRYVNWPEISVTFNQSVYSDQSIVKPDPIRDLNITLTNQSSMTEIEWFPPDLYNVELVYRIRYRSRWDHHWKEQQVQTQLSWEEPLPKVEKVLTNLTPNTKYEVEVSCKPVSAVGSLYWSNPVTSSVTTQEDVPDMSTTLTEGAYLQENCDDDFLRSLVIYWKNPPERYANGNITGYEIRIQPQVPVQIPTGSFKSEIQSTTILQDREPDTRHDGNDVVMKETQINVTGNQLFHHFQCRLRYDTAYTVEMKAGTEVGLSENISSLHIPTRKQVEAIAVHRVVVEKDGSRYLVTVSFINDGCDVTGLTIFWCTPPDNLKQFNNTFIRCQTHFDWFTIHNDSCVSETKQWISLKGDQSEKRFAASVAMDADSSGMMWESYRYRHNAIPDVPVYRVDTVPGNGSWLNIHIVYTTSWYQSDHGKPDSYEIFLDSFLKSKKTKPQCPTESLSQVVPADPDEVLFPVMGLAPDTDYVVCLRALNPSGSSAFSKPQTQRTASTPEESAEYYWVIGLIGGILLFLAVVFLVRKLWQKEKKSKKKFEEITDIHGAYKSSYNGITLTAGKDEEAGSQKDSGKGCSISMKSFSSEIVEECEKHFMHPKSGEDEDELSEEYMSDIDPDDVEVFESGRSQSTAHTGYCDFFSYDEDRTQNVMYLGDDLPPFVRDSVYDNKASSLHYMGKPGEVETTYQSKDPAKNLNERTAELVRNPDMIAADFTPVPYVCEEVAAKQLAVLTTSGTLQLGKRTVCEQTPVGKTAKPIDEILNTDQSVEITSAGQFDNNHLASEPTCSTRIMTGPDTPAMSSAVSDYSKVNMAENTSPAVGELSLISINTNLEHNADSFSPTREEGLHSVSDSECNAVRVSAYVDHDSPIVCGEAIISASQPPVSLPKTVQEHGVMKRNPMSESEIIHSSLVVAEEKKESTVSDKLLGTENMPENTPTCTSVELSESALKGLRVSSSSPGTTGALPRCSVANELTLYRDISERELKASATVHQEEQDGIPRETTHTEIIADTASSHNGYEDYLYENDLELALEADSSRSEYFDSYDNVSRMNFDVSSLRSQTISENDSLHSSDKEPRVTDLDIIPVLNLRSDGQETGSETLQSGSPTCTGINIATEKIKDTESQSSSSTNSAGGISSYVAVDVDGATLDGKKKCKENIENGFTEPVGLKVKQAGVKLTEHRGGVGVQQRETQTTKL